MIEKLYKKVKNIQDFNETASKLRQMGLKDELKNLAGKYKVPEVDLKEFLSGKRYFLIDGGETQKDYMSARSKLLDEMFNLNDPQFTDVIGNYLIKCCDKSDFADLVLQKHKTLQRCVESIMSRAYEMVSDEVKKSGRYANMAVLEDTVFKWVRDYCEFPYKSRVMPTSEPLKTLKAPYMARNTMKWGFFRLKSQ